MVNRAPASFPARDCPFPGQADDFPPSRSSVENIFAHYILYLAVTA
jgi:hypothetical protein